MDGGHGLGLARPPSCWELWAIGLWFPVGGANTAPLLPARNLYLESGPLGQRVLPWAE